MTADNLTEQTQRPDDRNVRISLAPPPRASMDYAGLRGEGLELIQNLAGETWTDHNLHDPGITVLEACCYAMTELGFRLQLDMADLLQSGAPRRTEELIPAHRILPTAPVTPEELRAVLLDHPRVDNARVTGDAAAEVDFFEDPCANPPFTYGGGYGFRVEIDEGAQGLSSFPLEARIPYPDESLVPPVPPDADLLAAGLIDTGDGIWQPRDEPEGLEGRLGIQYSSAGEIRSFDVPVSLSLLGAPDSAQVREAARAALSSVESGTPVRRYFTRIPDRTPTRRVTPRGLYEATLELDDRALNRSTFDLRVDVPIGEEIREYNLEVALPFWDEPEVAPLRAGEGFERVAMLDLAGVVWRALEEQQTFFGKLSLDRGEGEDAQTVTQLWCLMRITDELADPVAEASAILERAQTAIETAPPEGVVADFVDRLRTTEHVVRRVQGYLETWRNLGEAPVRLSSSRIQEIAVQARIQVTGGADLEELLAGVFHSVDRMLTPRVRFLSLAQKREQLRQSGFRDTVEAAFDGPLLRHGFLDEPDRRGRTDVSRVYVSDVLRLIMQRRGPTGGDVVAQENPSGRDIVAVTDLSLSNYVNNRQVTGEATDCLLLLEGERYQPRLSLAKSRILFVRDGIPVDYDRTRVATLFEELRRADRAAAMTSDPSPALSTPAGEALPVDDYYPFQNELPRAHGVGEAGLPDGAGPTREAQARQWSGYLMLFEQILSDAAGQIGSVNRLFSSNPDERSTYFTRPLLDLPGAGHLIRGAPAASGPLWDAWVADPANPYALALQEAVEDADRSLDRRNRMLDHLMARQGEQMIAWGQELHRRSRRELTDGGAPPETLAELLEERRRAVNARLIRDKAGFLADLPALNAARLQAFGDPLKHRPQLLTVTRGESGHQWTLSLDGAPLLRGTQSSLSAPGAAFAAEAAMLFASQPLRYEQVPTDEDRVRLSLLDGDEVLGESIDTWDSSSQAQSALEDTAARFSRLRLQESATPLERRVCHLTGIRIRQRRRLLLHLDEHFEIFDQAASGSDPQLRWRLREGPGASGAILLLSASHFENGEDGSAQEQVAASIDRALRLGLDEWNYRITDTDGGGPVCELRDPAGNTLALSELPLASESEAREHQARTIELLYRLYSAEGLYLVEHLALRPGVLGDPFLSIPAPGGAPDPDPDPYSQRISFVLPSGHRRDFEAEDPDAGREPAPPYRFADREFRAHAERMIRQACPAHLMPGIYWVDRRMPGNPDHPGCFEVFEQRYHRWLESILVPETPSEEISGARADLVTSLNAVVRR